MLAKDWWMGGWKHLKPLRYFRKVAASFQGCHIFLGTTYQDGRK
jgi:hypothetical protein